MNFTRVALPLLVLLLAGCSTGRVTNPRAPGPAVGNAVGYVAGGVAANVVGAGVGVVEGAGAATEKTFDSDRRIVRTWTTEVTSDGRTIRVPVEVEVDEYGRPIGQPKPAR